MSIHWKIIADYLRQELADYGGLLHLYDQQQRSLFGRQPDVVLQLSTAIQDQVTRVAASRERREKVVGSSRSRRASPRTRRCAS